MADLATVLNAISANPQSPDMMPSATVTPRRSFVQRMGDYIADTSMRDLGEAFMRFNPVTAPLMLAKDANEGKLIENLRLNAGQLSQMPTDVISGTLSLGPFASMVSESLGGPEFPDLGLARAAESVREFGKSYGEPIAGRELPDALLRGTGAEMGSTWMRHLAGLATPVPSKVTQPIVAGVNAMTQGMDKVQKATQIAGRTLEVLSPLAVHPTPVTVGANVGIGGTLGVGFEAGIDAAVKGAQQEANTILREGTNEAVSGVDQVREGRAIHASILPQGYGTGSDLADAAITLGIVGGALFAGYRSDLAGRITRGVRRATTGYNPTDPADATVQPLATQIVQDKLNSSESLGASLRRMYKETGVSNADEYADKLREEISFRSGPSVNTRLIKLGQDGEFLDTGVKTLPINDFLLKVQSSGDAASEAARVLHARQEADFRARVLRATFRGGNLSRTPIGSPLADSAVINTTTPLSAHAYNLYNIPTRDLFTIINNGMAKPEVAALVNGYHKIMRDAQHYSGVDRRFTPKEARDFARENPHFVPLNSDGGNYLDPRNITPNWDKQTRTFWPRGAETFEQLGNPFELLPKYLDELVRSTEAMKVKREYIIEGLRLARAGSQEARAIFGRPVPLGKDSPTAITWRDASGAKQSIEIKDAVVRNALTGLGNPTALQMSRGAMTTVAKVLESGAVGPLSLVGGTVFAPVSAVYSAGVGSAMSRPKGIAMGWGDKGMQALTGGKMGFRGDPTLALDALLRRAPANVAAVLTDRMSQAMHNAVITNNWMTNIADPATLTRWSQALQDMYRKSGVFEIQQQGLMGPSSFMAVDRAKLYGGPGEAFVPKSIPRTTWDFVNDIFHAISSSPAMSVAAMNKHLKGTPDEWKISAAIRNLSGDPGRSGAFKNTRGNKFMNEAAAVNATPWGNVYLQSMHRMAQSFRKDPAGTVMGVFNAAVLPAMMATLWNSYHGQDYAEHQLTTRPTDKRYSSVYVAQPGKPPTEGWEQPIDPMLRPFKLMGEMIAASMIGAYSGELWNGGNDDYREALGEAMMGRDFSLNPFGHGNMLGSMTQQTLLPPVPPAFQVAGASAGVNLRGYGDVRPVHQERTQGFAEGGGPNVIPDTAFGMTLPAQIEDMMRAMAGSGGQAIYDFFTGLDRSVQGVRGQIAPVSGGKALAYEGDKWLQRLGDSLPNVSNALFGTFRTVTPSQDASSTAVNAKLNPMRAIDKAFTATEKKNADFVGSRKSGLEERLGVRPLSAPDEVTHSFALDVHQYYKQLQPTLQELNAAYTQRQGIQADNRYGVWDKRATMEEYGYRIIDLNRRMLVDIRRFEDQMSMKYGLQVKLDKFNLGQSILQQFKPL